MRSAYWYFDVVSPFAYLHFVRFRELPDDLALKFRPVLLASLLANWQHKGPAEIPEKRRYVYRWCTWWATNHGINFTFPARHPFNSLRLLRFICAAGLTQEAVQAALEHVWQRGGDADDPAALMRLYQRFGLTEADIGTAEVKEQLRKYSEEAIGLGVFGVPTLTIEGQLFWGADSVELFNDWYRNPQLFAAPEYQRLEKLPMAAVRKT